VMHHFGRVPSSTSSLVRIKPDDYTTCIHNIVQTIVRLGLLHLLEHSLIFQRADHRLPHWLPLSRLNLVANERVLKHRLNLLLRLCLQIPLVQVFHIETVERGSDLVVRCLLPHMSRWLYTVQYARIVSYLSTLVGCCLDQTARRRQRLFNRSRLRLLLLHLGRSTIAACLALLELGSQLFQILATSRVLRAAWWVRHLNL